MLLVVAEYVAFVALSLWGGTPAPKNVSICGYLELLPDSVFFLYAHVAAAGVDCTLFHALAVFRRERNEGNVAMGFLRALLLATCALCLAGFSVIPRCLWTAHQNAVLTWVTSTSLAMFVGFARDRSLARYSPFPQIFGRARRRARRRGGARVDGRVQVQPEPRVRGHGDVEVVRSWWRGSHGLVLVLGACI
jgi:hypothetical protein